jgi:heme O synthase-like polyprenyltransferase
VAHQFTDFVTLTKPRLNPLVLVTTLADHLASSTSVEPRCW